MCLIFSGNSQNGLYKCWPRKTWAELRGHIPTFSHACQNVYESGIWGNGAVFFFPCALARWRCGTVQQLAANWVWTVLCAGVKKCTSKEKGGRGKKEKQGVDVRWVCGRLIPVGFFVACNVWEAKVLSPFDGSCGSRRPLNHITLWNLYISNCTSKANLHCLSGRNYAFTVDTCLITQWCHAASPTGEKKREAEEESNVFACLLWGNSDDPALI